MVATDELIGVRFPDATLGLYGGGWDQWKNGKCLRGAYMKVLPLEGPTIYWLVRDPTGNVVKVAVELVEEHEDGRTITTGPIEGPTWRGRIKQGKWEED